MDEGAARQPSPPGLPRQHLHPRQPRRLARPRQADFSDQWREAARRRRGMADPLNPAVRFVRAIDYFELPAIFGKRQTARDDFQILLRQIDGTARAVYALNPDTIQAIYYYAGQALASGRQKPGGARRLAAGPQGQSRLRPRREDRRRIGESWNDPPMNYQGKHWRTIWRNADDSVGVIDQRRLPHEFETIALRTMEDAAEAIRNMTVRGAPAHRRDGGLWHLPRAAKGFRRRQPCLRLRFPALKKPGPPRSICAGRSTKCARPWRSFRPRNGSRPPGSAPPNLCDEDVAVNEAIGRHGLAIFREDPREETGRLEAQCPHPLQRRLAGLRRLGHRPRADLHGPRLRPAGPCLGRRNAPAQPGRVAHRVGTESARRAAHRHRRQRRRPSHAARPGRSLHRRHRPHHRAGRRLQQDRHLPQGARGPRQRTCRFTSRCPARPSTGRSATA